MTYRRENEMDESDCQPKPNTQAGRKLAAKSKQNTITPCPTRLGIDGSSRKVKPKPNDLRRYQGILDRFKRVRILSRVEFVVTSLCTKEPVIISKAGRITATKRTANEKSIRVTENVEISPEDEDSASTASLTSSIIRGRLCPHPTAEWEYCFSFQEKTCILDDAKHHMLFEVLCIDLILAPVRDNMGPSNRVLDIGTGTGTWAMDGIQVLLFTRFEATGWLIC